MLPRIHTFYIIFFFADWCERGTAERIFRGLIREITRKSSISRKRTYRKSGGGGGGGRGEQYTFFIMRFTTIEKKKTKRFYLFLEYDVFSLPIFHHAQRLEGADYIVGVDG